MHDFQQVLQHQNGISTISVISVEHVEGTRNITFHHQLKEIKAAFPVGETQHIPDNIFAKLSIIFGSGCDHLIKQTLAISDRSISCSGNK